METKPLSAADLRAHSIPVFEPLAEFLQGSGLEQRFDLSLLDVVRFAGHCCPSMVGAFLVAAKAVRVLFPETGVCIRGDVAIELPGASTEGATGPMANVFSFITGAWGETGFGGLGGQFVRRGLVRFSAPQVSPGCFRFTRLSTGMTVDIVYDTSRARVELDPSASFQEQWRTKIKAILERPDDVVFLR